MPHDLLDQTTDILTDLIGFPSVSSEPNLDLITYLSDRLDGMAAETRLTRDAAGGKANLFATLGPRDVDGGIVLSGHTDVVPVAGQEWQSDPFGATVRDGLLYGRGSCDMKGFIACCLALAPRFMQAGLNVPLHFAFTYDEEVGCLGAQVMLKELARTGPRPKLCIVGEPTSMKIFEGHKGCCEYTTSFTGLEGHCSVPERGVNAVEYAVRYVTELMATAEALKSRAPAGSRFVPPWSTIQVGRMSGGIARNVIPGACEVEWELRQVNESDYHFAHDRIRAYVEAELLPRMRAVYPEADVMTEVIGEVAGLAPMSKNEALKMVQALTGANDNPECVSFGTEAGLFQQLGIDTVICGPGSIEQAHKPDEFVALDQLDQCLRMLEGLLPRLTASA